VILVAAYPQIVPRSSLLDGGVDDELVALFSVTDREAVLTRAVELLEADPRVAAAVITGSIGADRADRWSDFDLDTVLGDGVDVEEFAAEWDALAYREWPVVHHYATAFGSTLVRGYLLRNGLLADLAFTPIGDFSVWAPVRVAFDRSGGRVTALASKPEPWSPTPDWQGEAGFAAHDVLHAAVAARRDRPWQALYFLGRIRARTLALASERHGHDAEDAAYVDDLPPDELEPLTSTLVASLDEASLLEAIEAGTRAFLAELRRGDADLAGRLAEPLLLLVTADRPAVRG
jgi:hypothetical protein